MHCPEGEKQMLRDRAEAVQHSAPRRSQVEPSLRHLERIWQGLRVSYFSRNIILIANLSDRRPQARCGAFMRTRPIMTAAATVGYGTPLPLPPAINLKAALEDWRKSRRLVDYTTLRNVHIA